MLRFLLFLILPLTSLAQLPSPTLTSVFPAGGQSGTEVVVTVDGENLDGLEGLIFSHPGLKAERVMLPADEIWPEPRPDGQRFRVQVGKDVKAGMYDVRAVSWYGVSTPRIFVVGSDSESLESEEAHDSPETAQPIQLDEVIHGRPAANLTDYFKLSVEKGQRVLVHAWADRIDSKMDATLRVLDPAGREIATARDHAGLDPLLDFTAEEDGDYLIGIHDFLFRGGDSEDYYRLQATLRPHVDAVFPLSGPGATRQEFTLYGRNLPGGKLVMGADWKGSPLEALKVEIDLPSEGQPFSLTGLSPMQSFAESVEYRLPDANPIRVGVTDVRVTQEKPATVEQRVAVPVEAAGRMDFDGDFDAWRFSAKKGERLWVEVISHRLATPLDASLVLMQLLKDAEGNETEKVLMETDDYSINMSWPGFDVRTRDSGLAFTAPVDGEYRVLVLNHSGQASPLHGYQLAIQPAVADFRLLAIEDRNHQEARQSAGGTPFLMAGGTAMIRVVALRKGGFNGPIRLAVEGLPEGVTSPKAIIFDRQDEARIVLSAVAGVKDWMGNVTITGHAVAGEGNEIHRTAETGVLSWGSTDYNKDRLHSRLTAGLPLVVKSRPAVASLAPVEDKIWEVELGKTLDIPIQVTRSKDAPLKGALVVTSRGLPAFNRPPGVNIADGVTEGVLKLNFKPDNNNKPYVGEGTFVLQAAATVTHSPWAEGAAHLEEIRKQVEKNIAPFTSAKQKANDQVNKSQAALKTAEANLTAAGPEAKAGAVESVKKAREALTAATEKAAAADTRNQAAQEALKEATATARAAADRAKAVDFKTSIWSTPIHLRIVEPPKEDS